MRYSSIATLLVIGVSAVGGDYCYAQIGRTYALLRTDNYDVRARSEVWLEAESDFDINWSPTASDDMLVHTGASGNASDGNASAIGWATASALLTTPANTLSWNANSTVGVSNGLAASSDDYSEAYAEGIEFGLAAGNFKVIDFDVPDTTRRPVLKGAMYVLVNPGATGFMPTLTINQDAPRFSLISGQSNIYGVYEDYPEVGWHVTGTLASLDNPSVAIDMFLPRSMNHLFLFSHGATVDATYTTWSELGFGTVLRTSGNESDSTIYSASVASWFYVEEWGLGSIDPYEGQVVASPDVSYFPGDVDILAPEDNPDHPDHDPQP